MGKLSTLTSIIRSYKNWVTWLLCYADLLKRPLVEIRTRDGLRFLIRTAKKDIARIGEIFHLHEYDSPEVSPGKEDTVIDIGAHVGFFTVWAAKKAKRVISFEPDPETFGHLKTHMGMNKLTNVTAFQKAVSDNPESKTFYVADNSAMSSLHRKTDQSITVDCTTLPLIFEEEKIDRCGYLKLDCEGEEYPILFSLPDKIYDRIDAIVLEYHDQEGFLNDTRREQNQDVDALITLLEQKGYKVRVNKHVNKVGMLYAWRS